MAEIFKSGNTVCSGIVKSIRRRVPSQDHLYSDAGVPCLSSKGSETFSEHTAWEILAARLATAEAHKPPGDPLYRDVWSCSVLLFYLLGFLACTLCTHYKMFYVDRISYTSTLNVIWSSPTASSEYKIKETSLKPS